MNLLPWLIKILGWGVFVFFLLFNPQKTSADYPMYRYNQQRSGFVPYSLKSLTPLKWTSPNIGMIKSPPITSKAGDIYLSTVRGLTKLNKNGEVVWVVLNIVPSGPPVFDEQGNLYFATTSNPHLYSYNQDGKERWKVDLRKSFGGFSSGDNQARQAVTISPDKSTLYVGISYPAKLLTAFNLDGTLKWRRSINGQDPNISSTAISPDGTLYTGSGGNGYFFALSPEGDIKWYRIVVPSVTVNINTPLVGPDNNIYLTSYMATGGDVLASFSPNGNKRWTYKVNNSYTLKGPAIKDNTIYLAESNNIHAIKTDDGSLLWKWSNPSGGTAYPIVDKNGIIYTSGGNSVSAINPDGTLKESITLGRELGPLVLTEDGLILVYQNISGSWDGYLHALGTAPQKPLYPVIFIPGIGGSELKAKQDIFWSYDNGHGGIFSHAYKEGEKIWVNPEEAAWPGDDDYFDVLRLKDDGETSAAALSLTGNLTEFGYTEIDPFFEGIGYKKEVNFFVYPYDWRKDIRTTKEGLDKLIEEVKQRSGQPKVNIVAHSMGGLVARYYIADEEKAKNVGKLISLGVPHLGTVEALKAVMYGTWIGYDFRLFWIGIPPSEIKDVSQNMPGMFTLQPSSEYFNFYNNDDREHLYPFFDERDIDQNNEKGTLNFTKIKNLLTNLYYNMKVFGIAEQFHSYVNPFLNQSNNVRLYHIAGSSQPTLGQIKEGWWINWPFKIFNRYEEIYINGDDTVPLYSATLKNSFRDLSAGAKIYYVEQTHDKLVNINGEGMQTVKAILEEGDIPVTVKDQKISLEGQHLSVDQDTDLDLYDEDGNHTGLKSNGEVETNIPDTFFDTLGNTKHVFVKKKAKKVKVKVTPKKETKINFTISYYQEDTVKKTSVYRNIPVTAISQIEFDLDPKVIMSPSLPIDGISMPPTTEVEGEEALDQIPPQTHIEFSTSPDSSGNYLSPLTINLTSSDQGSGILNTYYSLDNGENILPYVSPITLTTPGTYTLKVYSTDKAGNDEYPQTITLLIISPTPTPTSTPTLTPIPTPTPSLTSSNSQNQDNLSGNNSITTSSENPLSQILSSSPQVLGASTSNNLSKILPVTEKLSTSITANTEIISTNKKDGDRLGPFTLPIILLTLLSLSAGLFGSSTLRFNRGKKPGN